MTKPSGGARSRLVEVRARLRKGWGLPEPEPCLDVENPDPAVATEACGNVETVLTDTADAIATLTGATTTRPDPLAPMTRCLPRRCSRQRSGPASTVIGPVSRRDLILGGTIAGVSGLAASIMRLPQLTPPEGPARAVVQAPRLFESPRSYIATEEFPAPPPAPAEARTEMAEARPQADIEAPSVPRGPGLAERRIALFNENTGELVRATYWAGGDYVLEELEAIHVLLRDHHVNEVRAMDLRLVEALHQLGKTLDTGEPLHILSAYRTRRTNERLAEHFHGVAVNSFHIKGKAVDVRVPGRSKRQVLRAALTLKAGGVGNYRSYVHLDTGPIRRW